MLVGREQEGGATSSPQRSSVVLPAWAGPVLSVATGAVVLGVLSPRAVVVLLGLLVAAAVALMALPTLLQQGGLDFRTWVLRDVLRR